MKRPILKLCLKTLIFCLIFIIIMSDITTVYAEMPSEILIDADSGRVLFAQNENVRRPMASTTKIATCLTVINNFDVNQVVEIKREWSGIEGSSIYLKEGEHISVKDLLYGLMLRSGNDAAVTLACAVGNNLEEFSKMMNVCAQNAGAKNTNFVNPHGLDDPNHYTTAYDLALITKEALNNDFISKIVSTKKYNSTGDEKRVFINKNKLLSSYAYCTGVKTGYTKKAGRCLVSSADKADFSLICVVLGCGPMYERSRQLFEGAYNNYERKKLADKESAVTFFTTRSGNKVPCYVAENVYYPLKPGEEKKIKIETKITYQGDEPIKFATEMGSIVFYLENQLLFEKKIYNIICE